MKNKLDVSLFHTLIGMKKKMGSTQKTATTVTSASKYRNRRMICGFCHIHIRSLGSQRKRAKLPVIPDFSSARCQKLTVKFRLSKQWFWRGVTPDQLQQIH